MFNGNYYKRILGGFSGTVGTVIGGSWKGIDYMRSQPQRRSGSFSQAQLEQQAKFSLLVKFLGTMTGLLRISFKDYAIKMTGFNNAMSYNIKNAPSLLVLSPTRDFSLLRNVLWFAALVGVVTSKGFKTKTYLALMFE